MGQRVFTIKFITLFLETINDLPSRQLLRKAIGYMLTCCALRKDLRVPFAKRINKFSIQVYPVFLNLS